MYVGAFLIFMLLLWYANTRRLRTPDLEDSAIVIIWLMILGTFQTKIKLTLLSQKGYLYQGIKKPVLELLIYLNPDQV
jgi:hypothetical protein